VEVDVDVVVVVPVVVEEEREKSWPRVRRLEVIRERFCSRLEDRECQYRGVVMKLEGGGEKGGDGGGAYLAMREA
jgi:hypothetical protein